MDAAPHSDRPQADPTGLLFCGLYLLTPSSSSCCGYGGQARSGPCSGHARRTLCGPVDESTGLVQKRGNKRARRWIVAPSDGTPVTGCPVLCPAPAPRSLRRMAILPPIAAGYPRRRPSTTGMRRVGPMKLLRRQRVVGIAASPSRSARERRPTRGGAPRFPGSHDRSCRRRGAPWSGRGRPALRRCGAARRRSLLASETSRSGEA
jgi:hypothetical protein